MYICVRERESGKKENVCVKRGLEVCVCFVSPQLTRKLLTRERQMESRSIWLEFSTPLLFHIQIDQGCTDFFVQGPYLKKNLSAGLIF